MKGKPEAIAALSKALKEELGAILQYFLHAEMCENWGYARLADFIKKQSIGEMKHAEILTERILFLEGIPNVADIPKLNIGKDVKQQLQNDLNLEVNAVEDYNHAIATCIKAGDNATADMLKVILQDEEGHVDFLETQLSLIKDLGLENYLIEQMGDEEEASE
jgi:bacterioferritin